MPEEQDQPTMPFPDSPNANPTFVNPAGPAEAGATLDGSPQPAPGSSPKEAFPHVEGYRITGRLGEGGMGTVWRAVQLSTNRQVALKLLGANAFGSAKAKMRFEREVELAARLEHPHIARVYDSGLHHHVYYYAMELVEGVSLSDYVEGTKLDRRGILELMRSVSQAVQHAHQRGIIHRDLKPSNILVSANGQPHVLDFGLAKTKEEDQALNVTMSGEVAGTPAYMAPEQAAGKIEQIDTRSDVYALGVILYKLLTGKNPHKMTGTRYEIIRRIAEEEIIRPREVSKEIDAELDALLLKALEKDAARRYGSAGELAADLDNYLTGEPLTAHAPTTGYFLRKKIRKHRLPLSIAAGVVAVLLGMAVYSYINITREKNAAVASEKKAVQQEQKAVAEEQKAVQQEQKALAEAESRRRQLYYSWIYMAGAEREKSNIRRARELLDGCPADLRGWEWSYLRNNLDQSAKTFNTNCVVYISMSQDGNRIVAGCYGLARFWDVKRNISDRLLRKNTVLTEPPPVAINPEGTRIFVGDTDGVIHVWDADSGTEATQLTGHTGKITRLLISPDGTTLASASMDLSVRIWDIATGKERKTTQQLRGGSVCVSFSPDSKILAYKDTAGKGQIYNLADGTLRSLGNCGYAFCIAVSPTGDRIAVCPDNTNNIHIIDARNLAPIAILRGHTDLVRGLVFGPKKNQIISAGWDRTIRVWDIDRGCEIVCLLGHEDRIFDFAVDADFSKIVTGSGDYTIKIWDLKNILSKGINCRRRSPIHVDGTTLLIGDGSAVRGVDLSSSKTVFQLQGTSLIRSVAASPDGKWIAAGEESGLVTIWKRDGLTQHARFRAHPSRVNPISFSADSGILVSGGPGDKARVWEVLSGKLLQEIEKEVLYQDRYPAIFSPRGNILAVAGPNNTLALWDFSSLPAAKVDQFDVGGKISSIAFTSDGARIAFCLMAHAKDFPSQIYMYDLVTRRRLMEFVGHGLGIRVLAFSPDGARLASIANDGTMKLWDTATGAETFHQKLNESIIDGLLFTPDGNQIIINAGPVMILDAREKTASTQPASTQQASSGPASNSETLSQIRDEGSPTVEADEEGEYLLSAENAEMHGTQLFLQKTDDIINIGRWKDPKDWLSWKVNFRQVGTVEVSVAGSHKGNGTEFAIESPDQRLTGTFSQTGAWKDFKTVSVGTLEIKQPGEQVIKMLPKDPATWQPMNVQAIILKPLPAKTP